MACLCSQGFVVVVVVAVVSGFPHTKSNYEATRFGVCHVTLLGPVGCPSPRFFFSKDSFLHPLHDQHHHNHPSQDQQQKQCDPQSGHYISEHLQDPCRPRPQKSKVITRSTFLGDGNNKHVDALVFIVPPETLLLGKPLKFFGT